MIAPTAEKDCVYSTLIWISVAMFFLYSLLMAVCTNTVKRQFEVHKSASMHHTSDMLVASLPGIDGELHYLTIAYAHLIVGSQFHSQRKHASTIAAHTTADTRELPTI